MFPLRHRLKIYCQLPSPIDLPPSSCSADLVGFSECEFRKVSSHKYLEDIRYMVDRVAGPWGTAACQAIILGKKSKPRLRGGRRVPRQQVVIHLSQCSTPCGVIFIFIFRFYFAAFCLVVLWNVSSAKNPAEIGKAEWITRKCSRVQVTNWCLPKWERQSAASPMSASVSGVSILVFDASTFCNLKWLKL